jgi:adenylate cyclase
MPTTQTVTVLFTDLVGPTEQITRFGEEAAERLRRQHFSQLRAVVVGMGGLEVKSAADGLMVTFNGVAAGLACAVGMQRAVAAGLHSPEPMSMRVGVAVGDVEEDAGDFYGIAVVEAAPLCARCEGGEILATDMVRLLARDRGGVQFDALGISSSRDWPIRWACTGCSGIPWPARTIQSFPCHRGWRPWCVRATSAADQSSISSRAH